MASVAPSSSENPHDRSLSLLRRIEQDVAELQEILRQPPEPVSWPLSAQGSSAEGSDLAFSRRIAAASQLAWPEVIQANPNGIFLFEKAEDEAPCNLDVFRDQVDLKVHRAEAEADNIHFLLVHVPPHDRLVYGPRNDFKVRRGPIFESEVAKLLCAFLLHCDHDLLEDELKSWLGKSVDMLRTRRVKINAVLRGVLGLEKRERVLGMKQGLISLTALKPYAIRAIVDLSFLAHQSTGNPSRSK